VAATILSRIAVFHGRDNIVAGFPAAFRDKIVAATEGRCPPLHMLMHTSAAAATTIPA
jgi:hypothetical protein